ncbi:cytochrome p450 family 76 subfamily c polypeptide 5-related [Citrus sinensis]|uniref:Cytochrome p450 family 76 subfamily c polypeptide 5-related n=1 Tax=Citrus sinensis TaxID=2711 RepID=A0ACB8LVY8_CITSI|nr:cytochrome p450 family 76 subfamily c polypeptide 5-related [Citrus sinensis]
MDILSCMLWVLFTWVLVITLNSFLRGCKAGSRKLPPGPTPYPVIGNLLELGAKPHRSLAKLSKIYGPVMSLKFGQVTTVVISSATTAREILQNQDTSFCNRTVPDALRAHQHDEFSMGWLPLSTPRTNLRKICNSHIFTTQKLDANQHLRRKRIQQLLAYAQENCRAGKAIDIGQAAFNTTLNFLWNTIFSVDLADHSSDTAREFRDMVWGIMAEAGKPNLSDHFPVLKKLDPQGIRRRMTKHFGKMLEDLFAAGADTTSNTLEWAMTELLCNPEALSKTRMELEQTIGKGNPIDESDIIRLPYLQAVVKETFRLHPAVPLLLPRKASTNTQVAGYTIPKDAQVLVNVWAIGRDEGIWENPCSFMPKRFLGSDIDVKGQNFELIPFGAGRRICPGLPLAIRMLYLMLGSLINSFDWKFEDGITQHNMDMEEKFGLTLQKAQPLHAIPIAI